MSLRLNPEPHAGWQVEWDALMQDEWLRKKTDRSRRVTEHSRYWNTYLSELRGDKTKWFIDIGPGCGETLELAAAEGFLPLGVDATDGSGGMGNEYLRACRMMHKRQRITVLYDGFIPWIDAATISMHGTVDCFNSRGSWEQVWSEYMSGPPHDKHHDCKQLSWKIDDNLRKKMRDVLSQMKMLLTSNGIIMIYANGSKNDPEYEQLMLQSAKQVGLSVDLHESQTVIRLKNQ